MKNKDKKFSSMTGVTERFTSGGYLPDYLTEDRYYRQVSESLKAYNVNLVSDNPLETLYNHIAHLNNIFRVLRRPWGTDAVGIQKASAYYLAYAKLSKEESDDFTDKINDFISSVCYLSEWYNFICQMQHFFCRQEKELKQVLEDQKQKPVPPDRPKTAETTYCLTVGKSELYGVTYKQIEELYKMISLFIEREKAPFECKTQMYKEHPQKYK